MFVSVPIVYIFAQLFTPISETWRHLVDNLLADYVINTLLLCIGVGIITLFLGIPTAWWISTCEFPFREKLTWLLVIPLAIPTYINAAIYKAIGGSWVMNMGGAIIVISLVLYPYVYLIARSIFEKQSKSLLEVAEILGKNRWQTFFSVALPLARPAIFGGLFLVLMEVLNEYGAVKYYNINTFTKGIFRAWFSLNDLGAAVKLSVFLMIFVFVLVSIESWERKKQRFHDVSFAPKPLNRLPLKGVKAWSVFLYCFLPLLLGFIIPIFQLLYWVSTIWEVTTLPNLATLIGNSMLVSLLSAFIITLVALLLTYAVRISNHYLSKWLFQIATLGYAVPGAVIAMGSMMFLLLIDNWLSDWIIQKKGFWLNATLGGLIYAYLVRFLAVGTNPISSGWQKISKSIDFAALLNGKRRIQTLIYLHLPLLKGSIMACMMLVFVDTLKELPLTLILRPFNFDTLATTAFEMADDERFAVAGISALIIITLGLIPIFILNKWSK
jgi:iron(III) transport system permease protein